MRTRDGNGVSAPVLVLTTILYMTGGAVGGSGIEWAVGWKPIWLALSLNGYSLPLSAGSVAALVVLLGYVVIICGLELSDTGRWIGIGFLIAFLAMPFERFDSPDGRYSGDHGGRVDHAGASTYTPPPLTMLKAIADGQEIADAPHYLRNWKQHFQYVYLMGPHIEDALPDVLDEIASYRRFTLYAVRKSVL